MSDGEEEEENKTRVRRHRKLKALGDSEKKTYLTPKPDNTRLKWRRDEDIKFDRFFAGRRVDDGEILLDLSPTGSPDLYPVSYSAAVPIPRIESKEPEKEPEHFAPKVVEKKKAQSVTLPSPKEAPPSPMKNKVIVAAELVHHGPSALLKLNEGSFNEGSFDENDDAKRQKRRCKHFQEQPPVLTIEAVNTRIAKIYRAKQQADIYAAKHKEMKIIPFDRFVIKYFTQEFGTRKAGRRHCRHFITSTHHHLLEQGKVKLPRIYLFALVSGLVTLPPSNGFNPRFSSDYLQPGLRLLFPNPRVITEKLGDGISVRYNLLRQQMEKAVCPLYLETALGGPFALSNYKKDLDRVNAECLLEDPSDEDMVDVDKSLYYAIDVWRFSDSLRVCRAKAAMKVLQRYIRRRRKYFQQKAQEELVQPSPRTATKLIQAKELDNEINPSE